ncbi:MAG: C_GCAxxG_C_C family protein [Clostridia bacterium]|nr:C_GCAxxG_C_C family protein [Clostridia bacterium]
MTNHAEIARQLFLKGYNCAQSVFCAFTDVTGYDIDTSARMASSFGGGLGRLRETCGVVSAAALVLSVVKGYDDPADYEAKKRHYALVREFADRFKRKNISINCSELLTLAGLHPESGGEPEQRSEEFYQIRPCPHLVYDAALILDEMLQSSMTAGNDI